MSDDVATLNRTRGHTSLSRPQGEFVDRLPEGVAIAARRSPWRQIVGRLVRHPVGWYGLTHAYTKAASAAHSARKVLEEDYEAAMARRVEYAYEPLPGTERVVVYLRLRREGEGEDDEG